LYGPPGYSYVYLNYGIHCLANVVTEPPDSPAAVLVRALDPIDGIARMRRRRLQAGKGRRQLDPASLPDEALCRGPGNLTLAMGITLAQNRLDLLGDCLFVEDTGGGAGRVLWSPRIGIRVGTMKKWRAHVAGHPAVSRSVPASSAREPRFPRA
jgi:DNA-3-methyladenine glycosylase